MSVELPMKKMRLSPCISYVHTALKERHGKKKREKLLKLVSGYTVTVGKLH